MLFMVRSGVVLIAGENGGIFRKLKPLLNKIKNDTKRF